MDQVTPQYCRLCLNASDIMLNIYNENEPITSIAMILSQHFWFEIKVDDQYSKRICVDCWNRVQDFHLFYSHIYVVHTEFYSQYNNEVKTESTTNITRTTELSEVQMDIVLIEELAKETNLINELAAVGGKIDEINVIYDTEILEKNDNDQLSDGSEDLESSENENISDDELDDKQSEAESNITKRKRNKIKKRKTLEELERIEQEDHQISEYFSMVCELCPAEFRIYQDIKTHYRVEHKMKGYLKCCSKKFVQRCHVLDHIKRHLNPDTFKCEKCNKCYADKRGLQNHMHFHLPNEQKAFKCPHCPKSYAKNCLLRQHLQRHIIDREKPFFCDQCGKSFASKYVLQAHKRGVHEGAFVHVCEICAKSFKSKLFYEHHIKAMHSKTPLPKQQCLLCGAWLKHENSLRRHMKRHEDAEKEHICSLCGKQSPNRGALRSHQKYVHMVERTHKCNVCDKAFKKAVTLKEHMTMHTGEILYTCPHCPKTFNSSANMHSHRKKIHPLEFEETRRQRLCYNENPTQ